MNDATAWGRDAAPLAAARTQGEVSADVTAAWEAYRRQADRYFRASLSLTGAITAVWLYFVVTGRDGGAVFKGYQISLEAVGRVAAGLAFMAVLWGWLWYGIKVLLLRKLAGFSKEEVRAVFRSRLAEPFDLQALLGRHSERRVRIADMIGRRGRFLTIGLLGYSYVYARVSVDPKPEFLFMGLQESLFDAIAYNWMMLGLFYSNGFLGLLPGLARDLPLARLRERARPGLGRAGGRGLALEHVLRALLPARDRRLYDGDRQRACAGPSAAWCCELEGRAEAPGREV